MKKIFVIVAILGLSMWGVSELNAALSFQGLDVRMGPASGECARATEECENRPGHYKVVCKDGGAGYACTYECPYILNATDCENPE